MNRPFVVCHMLCSMDGKIEGSFMAAPEALPGLAEYGKLRGFYNCTATLYGTITMEEGYSDGLAPKLDETGEKYPMEDYIAPSDVKNYIVSLDPAGILGFSSPYIEKKGRPRAHVIEVLTEQVKPAYLSYLRAAGVSYVFAGKRNVDCTLLLQKLKSLFSIDRLMIAGGGITNRSFLAEGLIDEMSLVIVPLVSGNGRAASVFEQASFLPVGGAAAFTLKDVKRIEGNSLWLRYARQA